MSTDYFVSHVLAIAVLFLLASIAAIFFKKLRFPYTIGLVVIGIVFLALIEEYPALAKLEDIKLSHDIILYIILPTLIFDAAINIDSRLLVKNLLPVSALAIPGLIISTLIIGFLMCKWTPLGLGVAMLFGALISATDPVAVIALFNEIGAPKRLTMLVDGESLFNDATAIVAFNIVMAMIVSGVTMNYVTLSQAAFNFIYVFVGGVIAGVIIGFILTRIINMAKDEPLVQIALSTVTAYASFLIADHYLEVSGVMSTLGAGIVVSWYGSTRFTKEAKEYLKQYWEYAAFAANSFIFLMLGMTEWELLIRKGHSQNLIVYLIYTIIIVTFARFVVVYGIIPLLRLFPKFEKISFGYQTVIFWGGLRGAVPLALVLSLSPTFESQQLITEFTLGIVLFTLLVQGTTTKLVMNLFRLGKATLFEKIMLNQAKLESIEKSKELLTRLEGREYLSKKAIEEIKVQYKAYRKETKAELKKLENDPTFTTETIRKLIWNQALSIEQTAYQYLFERGLISESAIRELELHVENEKERLVQGFFPSLQISSSPLEVRVQNFFVNLLRLLTPKSEFIRILRLKSIAPKYEMILAMVYANRHINSVIEKISQPYKEQKNIIEECQNFYKKRVELALIQKKKIERHASVLSLQKQTLSRAALDTELDSIEEQSNIGTIPDSVANILKAEIEAKIKKLDKNSALLSKSDLKI